MNGVLVIDKPAGLTSHDVVARVRRLFDERSVGHLGTLDPMATGVLPLVLGKLTRLAQFYNGAEKSYEGEIQLGFATDTYDAQGDRVGDIKPVTCNEAEIRAAAARFVGPIEQMPPPFSAKKIGGVPAYKLARKGREVELKPVQIEIKEFEVLVIESDRVWFRSRVSSGTYLRSIAHEMGAALGCGGHLAALRRIQVAEFTLDDAHTLPVLETMPADQRAEVFVHPRRTLPQLPSVTANDEQLVRIRTGQSVNLPELSRAPLVKVFYGQADLICVAQRIAGTLFHPKVVVAETT